MVADHRAARLDLAARAKFAKDGDQIIETRSFLADLARGVTPDIRTAADKWSLALDHGFIEEG